MHRQNIVLLVTIVAVAALVGIGIAGLPEPVPAGLDTPVASSSTTTTSMALTTSSVGTLATNPAGDVRVLVANGSGVEGAAGALTLDLRGRGFSMLAPTTVDGEPSTVVYFRTGFEADARAIATLLTVEGGRPSVEELPQRAPVPGTSDADVVVLLGDDFEERAPA